MEFNPLPDLLNTGFTIIEFGLFHGGEHLEAKILVGTKSGMTTCENTSNTG